MFIGCVASAALSDSVKRIADCSLVNSKKFEITEVLDSRIRLQQTKNQYRPRLQGSVSYGEQISEGITFASSTYSLDVAMPVYNGTLNADMQLASKSIHVSEARLIQKTYQMTLSALQEILDLYQKEQEMKILSEEKTNYEKLVSTTQASSHVGLSDKVDSLLAQLAYEKTASKIKFLEIEIEKTLKIFVQRYGFAMTKFSESEFATDEDSRNELLTPELRLMNSELSLVTSEIQKEKSYLLPQVDISGGVFSQLGVLPYNGYRIGLSFDFSGLLRSSKIKSSVVLRKQAIQEQRGRIASILGEERKLDSIAVDALEKQINAMGDAIKLAERATQLSREKIRLGRSQFTEFAAIQDTVRGLRMEFLNLQQKLAGILIKRATERYFSESQLSLHNAACSLLIAN